MPSVPYGTTQLLYQACSLSSLSHLVAAVFSVRQTLSILCMVSHWYHVVSVLTYDRLTLSNISSGLSFSSGCCPALNVQILLLSTPAEVHSPAITLLCAPPKEAQKNKRLSRWCAGLNQTGDCFLHRNFHSITPGFSELKIKCSTHARKKVV